MFAEVVGGVGVEAEVAVQEIGVGVVVKLAAAETALEADGSERRAGCAEIESGHVAGDLGNPIAEILRAARDHSVGILIAAVDNERRAGAERRAGGEPGEGREVEIE